MGARFSISGCARQVRIDLGTLLCRRIRGGPTLSQRALALDRLAGSLVIAGFAGAAIWLANQTLPVNLLQIPLVSESAQAASGAPDAALQELTAQAAKPQAAKPQAVNSMSRSEIRTLQSRLIALGYDPGPVDGIAGRRTLTALNLYRAARNLEPAAKIDRAFAADLLN